MELTNKTNKLQEKFEKELYQHIVENNVTIANSFNSGKLPIYLTKKGYKVIVTSSFEKMNLYARFLEASQELDMDNLKQLVLFSSGLPIISRNYKILFITYNSELIREILNNKNEKAVLIIEDSYNSIAANILFSLFKKLQTENCTLKLVIINNISKYNQKLSKFFDNATIILNQDPKTHNVTFRQISQTIETLLLNKSKLPSYKGKTFLVLLQDHNTIHNLVTELQKNNIDATLLKITTRFAYNDIVKNVQQKDGTTKIIFTTKKHLLQNFSELDIDILVDSGIEKRTYIINGCAILSSENISKYDIEQRKAFVGKYSPGTYYLCSTFEYNNRKEVKTEHTTTLGNMLLTLLSLNIDTRTFKFLNNKMTYLINETYMLLKKLDAINPDGITDIGIKMEQIPLEVSFSRIIVEAEKYDLKFDAFICILLQKYKKFIRENKELNYLNLESDLFAQLYWFKKLFITDNLEINWNVFDHSIRLIELVSILGITPNKNSINTKLLKRCLAAGLPDSLYISDNNHGYQNHIWEHSHLLANSCLNTEKAKYIVGFCRALPNSKNISIYRILYPTSFTLEEVIECYSKFFKTSYSICENNIFEHHNYNKITIQSKLLGTVEELKSSIPEAFHEESETISGELVKSLYFYDLRINSIPT